MPLCQGSEVGGDSVLDQERRLFLVPPRRRPQVRLCRHIGLERSSWVFESFYTEAGG